MRVRSWCGQELDVIELAPAPAALALASELLEKLRSVMNW